MQAITQEVQLPDPYAAYVWRPLHKDDSDLQQLATLIGSVDRAANLPYVVTLAEMWEEYAGEFDIDASTRGIFTPEGSLIGSVEVHDLDAIPVRNFMAAHVHPDHQQRGLEEVLIAWGEQRARQAVDRCPPEARVVVRAYPTDGHANELQAYLSQGFQHVRDFYRMHVTLDAPPPAPQYPDQVYSTRLQYPQEMREYCLAHMDAFQDHWGFVMQPVERVEEMRREWFDHDALFDPSLMIVVRDKTTHEIAAYLHGRIEETGDPSVGYVHIVGTRRAYRGQGIAGAMLNEIFGIFYARGKRAAALHTDASNLTGALRLYEGVGMRHDIIERTHEKELRPGVDLTTQTINA